MSDAQGERIRFCSQCGSDVAFDVSVCPVCSHEEGGWRSPPGDPTNCRACEADVPAGIVHCPRCGAVQGVTEALVPSVASNAVDEASPDERRDLMAQTLVLLAPALLLGAIALALR